ncbi:MAG: DUF4355 domain-containing protein [Erysipelotrichaceae bacterium]|nr:DUF4355 domain-containing protein [Erysipelotrichaceae bacterium]
MNTEKPFYYELTNRMLDLHRFDDEGQSAESEAESEETAEEDSEDKPRTYTQEELDKIVKSRLDRERKAQEKRSKAEEEAAKLANMNEAEKQAKALADLQKELADLKAESKNNSMGKVARDILSEKDIHVSDGIISSLIKDDADSTSECVKSFIAEFEKAVERKVKEKVKGTTPRVPGSGSAQWTKEKIMKVRDTEQRQKLIAEHRELF